MATSSIEWTELTWNPTTGCDKVSAGCKNCYAETMTRRLAAMGVQKYKDGFSLRTHPEMVNVPYSWKKPAMVFVNSMSDLFHPDVPSEFIQSVFEVMNDCPHLIFQVLTKRSKRLAELAPKLKWTQNVWMGVSVENEDVVDRIDDLRAVPAAVRFLSCEPLLGPLPNLKLKGIDWVIAGGESGFSPRPMDEKWVLDLRDLCEIRGVAFFFKQWGGKNKKSAGRTLQGNIYSDFPNPKRRKVKR